MDNQFNTVQHMMIVPDEREKLLNQPTRAYVRDTKAMASTPVDVKEYPNSYAFIVDMPGLKLTDIKLQVEEEDVLVITGECRLEKFMKKYKRMEQSLRKFMRKFKLPADAKQDAISATFQDGVLTVTIPKLPPPEPKKPKTIAVSVA
uniref:SHSP domain-containing protein n=1 Tax=Araucaria cunninghamii TaxID=56994 RepID=A0A0D6QSN7_ARACU